MAKQLTARVRAYAISLYTLSREQGLSGEITTRERGARYLSLGVRMTNELEIDKALKLAEPLALRTRVNVVIAKRVGGLVTYQFELAPAWWEKYTRADLTTAPDAIGVGLSDDRRQVNFAFDPPHALVTGTTGSGKSEAVKSILCGLFTAHTPDELTAAIVDPDRDHVDVFRNVAHLAGVPIASDRGDITRVLSYAHTQYIERKRGDLRDGPAFVTVIDEAEDALDDPNNLALVAPIARHGRKYRCYLVLATQKPNETSLPNMLHLVNNRFVGLVQNAHLSAIWTGQPGLDCHRLTGSGDFMHVAGATQERLLFALATAGDFDRLPRGEMTRPEAYGEKGPVVIGDDEPDLDDAPDGDGDGDRGPGRPISPIEAVKVAYYLVREPGNVSQREARQKLGLGKDLHYRHRDFANELIGEVQRLLQAKGGKTNGRQ